MNKNTLLVFSFVFAPFVLSVASGATETLAYSDKDVSEVVAKPLAPVKRTAADEAKLAEKRKKIGEKKKELNGSEWEVTVKSQDKKEKEVKDTLTFQNNQVRSASLSKRGFSSTNYTVALPDGSETAIWETMKTGKDGVIFMRGEWNGETMTGSINENLDGGKVVREYYFTSSARAAVAPTSTEKEEEMATPVSSSNQPAMVSKEAASATKAQSSKKKGGALSSY